MIVVFGLVGAENLDVYIVAPFDGRPAYHSDPIDFHPPNRGMRTRQLVSEFSVDPALAGDEGGWLISVPAAASVSGWPARPIATARVRTLGVCFRG